MKNLLNLILCSFLFLLVIPEAGQSDELKYNCNAIDKKAFDRLLSESLDKPNVGTLRDNNGIGVEGRFKIVPGKFKDTSDAILGFIGKYRNVFGLKDVETELKFVEAKKDRFGTRYLYQQVYMDIPILKKHLAVIVNNSDEITRFAAMLIPTPSLESVKPSVTSDEASRLAKIYIQKNSKEDPGKCVVNLIILTFDCKPVLAYQVNYNAWECFINAINKEIIHCYNIGPIGMSEVPHK